MTYAHARSDRAHDRRPRPRRPWRQVFGASGEAVCATRAEGELDDVALSGDGRFLALAADELTLHDGTTCAALRTLPAEYGGSAALLHAAP